MKVLSVKQMAQWDRLSLKKIPATKLMFRAAQAVFHLLQEEGLQNKSVLILAGPGNNGGDGLALATLLESFNIPCQVFAFFKKESLAPSPKYFYNQLKSPVIHIKEKKELKKIKAPLNQSNYLVDALFGIGLNRPIQGIFEKALSLANQSQAKKIAIDIPSGISAETGEVLGKTAFKADKTLSFEVPKIGQLKPVAWDYVGKLFIRPIGLLKSEEKKIKTKFYFNDPQELLGSLKKRSFYSHKRSVGKVLILAGSSKMMGAGYLAALAAYRSGAGWVKWGVPYSCLSVATSLLPEAIIEPLEEKKQKLEPISPNQVHSLCQEVDSILLGPGWGRTQTSLIWMETFLQHYPKNKPLVLDGDALYLLAKNKKLFSYLKEAKVLLTPHLKEMARLWTISLEELLAKREDLSIKLAKKYKIFLILKGHHSLFINPKGNLLFNACDSTVLASAGSGDVLAGLLSGLLSQGYSLDLAAKLGLFIHGRAGELWEKKQGPQGLLARDLCQEIPSILGSLI
ncbi:MAG: NAD(P)H-hydrate dehydratase [Deltaproteobacteria bacterium]|nr:NAD(P)H-hydrate dehydratase [Deltaproteobacteria bacterium]